MISQKGFTHILVPLLVVLIIASIGSYFLVSTRASPAINTGYVKKRNPHTSGCQGNSIKYGSPRNKTATSYARQRVFGSPYPDANLTTINFMGMDVSINKKIDPCLRAVEWDLLYKYKTNYRLKYIYGASQIDANNPTNYFHPYGAAVDINPPDNPFYLDCKTSCPHDIPASWVKAFKAHGFFWGGNYKNSKDYMHFEWHGQK